MVSARRAARAGLNQSTDADDGVPEWVWGREYTARQWIRDHDGQVEGRFKAARAWRIRRDEWLQERGLVVDGMSGVSYEDYKRIEREEPHRILRRPEGEGTFRG